MALFIWNVKQPNAPRSLRSITTCQRVDWGEDIGHRSFVIVASIVCKGLSGDILRAASAVVPKRPSYFAGRPVWSVGRLWPPSAVPSLDGARGGQICRTGQRSRSPAMMWRGSGRGSCTLQLWDSFVFSQYEIDSNRQHDRLGPTCQIGCQVERLCLEQSATVLWWPAYVDGWQRRRRVDDKERKRIVSVFASFRNRWLSSSHRLI